MDRFIPWLALIIAASVCVVAVLELDNRANQTGLAIQPSAMPSPTRIATPTVRPPPTAERARTPEPTTRASVPAPAPTHRQAATPTATPTVAPPRTPTPAPVVTPGQPEPSRGRTPKTGGGAVPNGLLIAALALAARAMLNRRRRAY